MLSATQPSACSPEDSGGGGTTDTAVLSVLTAVGPQVVLPALDAFLLEAEGLVQATEAWSLAVSSGGAGEAERQVARERWWATMVAWQVLEVLQVGPAASSLTAVAGADLRDQIYSWPVVNPCRVDQETVLGEWDAPSFFTERLVNSYGLDALEHLLYAGSENACPSQVDINAEGSWDALDEATLQERRAAYAVALARHVQTQGQALRDAWDPSGGDFSGALAMGTATPYADSLEALNAVFDGLFYLETSTKDEKLAVPLGLKDCDAERCPESVELLASGASTDAILANVRGFRALFSGSLTGGDGEGLDDLLVALGHGDLSDAILSGLDTAEAAALPLAGVPLSEAVVTQPAAVEALYAAIQEVSGILKGDLATVLVLQIPDDAAGDND